MGLGEAPANSEVGIANPQKQNPIENL